MFPRSAGPAWRRPIPAASPKADRPICSDDRRDRALRFVPACAAPGSITQNCSSISSAVASRPLSATIGGGSFTIVCSSTGGAHDVRDDGRHARRRNAHDQVLQMRFVGTADIGQAELGEKAVRQNDDVVRAGQEMRRPPGAFDDASLRAVAEQDPVADDVGPAERQRDAGEDVTERVLQRQAENDGNHARGGDQRADRNAEDEGEDRQGHAEIDDADDEVLQQTGLARPALEDQIDAHEADERPCQMHPPEQLRADTSKRRRRHPPRSSPSKPVRERCRCRRG